MRPFRERLRDGPVVVSDGGLGTLLMERGLEPGEPAEALTLSDPAAVQEVADAYASAGAEIVHANTFGASPLRLAEAGLEEQAARLNHLAVVLARDGAAGRAWVSLSVGPSGRLLEPFGDVPEAAAFQSFVLQAKAGVRAGVDLVTVETMTDPREAAAAVRAVRSVAPDLPVIATMAFDPTPGGPRTVMSTTVAQAVEALAAAGADAVGANCGHGVEVTAEIGEALMAVARLPVVLQANAGRPEVVDGRAVYPETPADFARVALRMREAGVRVVGGCCGTTPAHVRAIREALRRPGGPTGAARRP